MQLGDPMRFPAMFNVLICHSRSYCFADASISARLQDYFSQLGGGHPEVKVDCLLIIRLHFYKQAASVSFCFFVSDFLISGLLTNSSK